MSEDGKKYIRFIMWHQLWLTSNNLEADDAKFQVTPSIRRSRFLAFSQISPKFLILTHFGLNSLSPGNATTLGNNGDSPQLFLHGAWGELKISDHYNSIDCSANAPSLQIVAFLVRLPPFHSLPRWLHESGGNAIRRRRWNRGKRTKVC